MNKNKKVLVLSTIGILVMIGCVIGITYAWFTSDIDGSGANFNVTTATVGPLTYTGTEITATGVLPGWISEDATLKVEGTVTGEQNVAYTCYIENTGSVTDVEYRVSGDGTSTSENEQWRNINDSILVSGVINNTNSVDEYKLAVRFKETGLDQNDQQEKTLSVNVTCEVVDASVDANIVAWTLDGKTQTGEIPKQGEGYWVQGITCTNGATAEWDSLDWGIDDLNNMTETPTSCTIDFSKFKGCEDGTLCDQILADNPNVSTREAGTFNAIFTTSNGGNTIYREELSDGSETYYFAGAVTNNYVNFAGKIWRIVRINEDGSVRLIYAGTSATDAAGFSTTSQAFNTAYNRSEYVGYKYTLDSQHGHETDSTVKDHLDEWYASNLSNYDGYISRTAIYCNDRTVGSGTWSAIGTTFYYAGYTRLVTNYSPTFACSNAADRFTTSGSTGNGQLHDDDGNARPIGMLTADEAVYAGALWDTQNTSYYLAQNANSSSSGVTYWWTMTPCHWYDSVARTIGFVVGGSTNSGDLDNNYVYVTHGVRPVISLKACATWSGGDGTSGNAYTVTVDDACAASEN